MIRYGDLPVIEGKEGEHAKFGSLLMKGLRKEGGVWVSGGTWEKNKVSFEMEAQAAAGYEGSFWGLRLASAQAEEDKDESKEEMHCCRIRKKRGGKGGVMCVSRSAESSKR